MTPSYLFLRLRPDTETGDSSSNTCEEDWEAPDFDAVANALQVADGGAVHMGANWKLSKKE